MNEVTGPAARAFVLEKIFDSWEEYQAYFEQASKLSLSDGRANSLLRKIMRSYFEVEFINSIESPRYFFPMDSETIILQIPSNRYSKKTSIEYQLRLLDEHQHVVPLSGFYLKDQLAMRLKIMGVKVKIKNKKKTKRS